MDKTFVAMAYLVRDVRRAQAILRDSELGVPEKAFLSRLLLDDLKRSMDLTAESLLGDRARS